MLSHPGELAIGDGSRKVWRLRKAMYCLKHAALEWHNVAAAVLRDLAFFRYACDPALFISKYGRCIILIWVDDLLVVTTADIMKPLCDQILARFKGRTEGVTRRKLQTPGIPEEHKRQETRTINPIGPTDTPHRPSTKHYRKDSPGDA